MPRSDFNWTEPFNLLLVALVIVLLVVQCGLLYARHRYSGRFGLRLALNVLLGLSIMAWIVDPYLITMRSGGTGLLLAADVPASMARHLKDSLSEATVLSAGEIEATGLDTLVMLGNAFDQNVFAAIRQTTPVPYLQWIPYFEQDQVQALNWKGTLRKGELQRIDGEIGSSRKQMLEVRYGDQILDSTELGTGVNRFRLAFPAFSEGRTAVTLHLNGRVIDTLRFFTRPEEKLTIRFLLESPDFETRNLATWLGRNGHSVLYSVELSRNVESSLNINRAKDPDLIVTTPAKAGNAIIKKAVSDGKSVLFLGLSEPGHELRNVNQALGTGFLARKISNEESVPLSPGLNALPFRFQVQNFQLKASHFPVLVEKTTGKIAVSLLNETFPLQLSGDSIAYGKVWNEILAWTRPASGPVIAWDAPVFKDLPVALHWNNFNGLPASVQIGSDTIGMTVSALNDRSATAYFRPRASGWLPVRDSLHTEVFAEDKSSVMQAAQMQDFVRSSNRSNNANSADGQKTRSQRMPSWGWFALLMVCLTALWIEPKL
nr:hypothetical protein [uncultured Dyadobacter sp.]